MRGVHSALRLPVLYGLMPVYGHYLSVYRPRSHISRSRHWVSGKSARSRPSDRLSPCDPVSVNILGSYRVAGLHDRPTQGGPTPDTPGGSPNPYKTFAQVYSYLCSLTGLLPRGRRVQQSPRKGHGRTLADESAGKQRIQTAKRRSRWEEKTFGAFRREENALGF